MFGGTQARCRGVCVQQAETIVIGAGPAGLAASLELAARGARSVLLIELGRPASSRPCPVDVGQRCDGCGGICHVISGFGGCLHAGDAAKFSLMPCARRLGELLGEARAQALSDEAFAWVQRNLGEPLSLAGDRLAADLRARFASQQLELRGYPVATVTETQVRTLLDQLHAKLEASGAVKLLHGAEMVSLRETDAGFELGLRNGRDAEQVQARNVVLATGRRGVTATAGLLRQLQVPLSPPASSYGVRLELAARHLDAAGRQHPDLKLSWRRPDQKIKTFCFCAGRRGGRIKLTNYQQAFGEPVISLDGHLVIEGNGSVPNPPANFAVLIQTPESRRDGERWLQEQVLPRYRDLSAGRPLAQRLDDFRAARSPENGWAQLQHQLPFEPSVADLRSGPLHALFADADHLKLVEGIDRLLRAVVDLDGSPPAPETLAREVLVVGPELEFLWPQVQVDRDCQTPRSGLFVVGDAAGYGQGIIPAMMTGLAAARRIAAGPDVEEG